MAGLSQHWETAESGDQALLLKADAPSVQHPDEIRWSALMVSAQAGNETDYRELLRELTAVIQKFLLCRFGHAELVEDCVQEALIALHQARHTYNPKRPFRPWMFAIVRNRTIDVLRQQRTRTRALESHRLEQEALQPARVEDEHEQENGHENILEGLSEQHRQVLVLTKVIGFSIAETAQQLGISQGAVKVRVHRAIRAVRRRLEDQEYWTR
jgi:RNA polymerase sigma-70 factor (ECF subfamily)